MGPLSWMAQLTMFPKSLLATAAAPAANAVAAFTGVAAATVGAVATADGPRDAELGATATDGGHDDHGDARPGGHASAGGVGGR